MTRVYISGKISGLNPRIVQRKFEWSEVVLERMGFKAVNPLRTPIPYNAPWWLHMIFDILLLLTCRTIYLQVDWESSRGARIEHKIAQFRNFKIIKQK